MMKNQSNLEKINILPGKNIIAEGATDKDFFDTLLSGDIKNVIYTNGFNNLKNVLPNLLEKAAAKDTDTEEQKKLAIIIDADYPREQQGNSHGYQSRRIEITNIMEDKNYIITPDIFIKNQGEVFKNKDPKIAPIGLWIMPNHQYDGMLEDFLLPCIEHPERKEILDIVDNSIADLKSRESLTSIRFSDTHESKVRLSTWLDWQKKPNNCRMLSPACALKEGWINPDHDNIKALSAWLTRVFQ